MASFAAARALQDIVETALYDRRHRRTLRAADFFQGMLMTARAPDELLEEVRFPLAAAGQRSAFTEFSARHGDFAIVSAAAFFLPPRMRRRLKMLGR